MSVPCPFCSCMGHEKELELLKAAKLMAGIATAYIEANEAKLIPEVKK